MVEVSVYGVVSVKKTRRALQNIKKQAKKQKSRFWDFWLIFTAQGPIFVDREIHQNDRLAELYKISIKEAKIKISIFVDTLPPSQYVGISGQSGRSKGNSFHCSGHHLRNFCLLTDF